MPSRWLNFIRRCTRTAVYSSAFRPLLACLERLAPRRSEHETGEYWDGELSGRMSEPNLNGRMSNAVRDTTSVLLMRNCGGKPRRVLDIGCGFADLAHLLIPDGLEYYEGVDLSSYVIDRNKRLSEDWAADTPCRFSFRTADLRAYAPDTERQFDVVVFNEVLKYLDVDEAIGELERYCQWLAHDGVICVNLTDDPKCRFIFKQAARHLDWVYGVVYQQRPEGPKYKLTFNRATPAYLTGLFRYSARVARAA